tara:strand:+ start:445 stop:1077 length:633 start_codon:yes stop_codon:yes gene_type:complete
VLCAKLNEPSLINTNIGHRFYGPISDGLESLYGMDNGANVILYSAYALSQHDQLHVQRIRQDKEFQVGYQRSQQFYNMPLYVTLQLNAMWFNSNNESIFNGFTVFGLSYNFGGGQLHSTIGIDHFENKRGLGSAIVLSIHEDWDLITEGYTTTSSKDSAFSLGLVYHTFGHRFKIGIHNSTAMSFRTLMNGTANRDWVFGFQIHRLLEWE